MNAPITVTEFETTPNPNAMKCWLDRPVSDGPRSFRNQDEARQHPLAAALFAKAGVTNVYFNGSWMTVNKPAEAAWATIKRKVSQVLAAAPAGEGEVAPQNTPSAPSRPKARRGKSD